MSLLPSRPATAARRTRTSRLTAAVTLGALGAGALLALAVPAQASGSTTATHDPIGSARSITPTAAGLQATGWAGDPDSASANVPVIALLDGRTVVARTVTSLAMPAVSKAHHLGRTPGFALPVPVPTGNHTVCIVVRNQGSGLDKVLTCVLTPLGRSLTPSKVAKHSPRGAILHGWASRHAVHYSGWVTDPDDIWRDSVVTLYLDGAVADTATTQPFPWPRPTGAAYHSAYSFDVPATSGSHLGCLWADNVGIGAKTFLGCKVVDTRSHQALTDAAPASINAQVVTEAAKHIGQRYVWGATGPKSFDCSGLVTYAYGKFGYSLPHQSGMQFTAARAISAGNARPGDLVFYHDSTGDVYHVGIYTGPAMTIAAIDEAEGVDHQRIWDPTWATYGSFTHT